MGFINSTVPVLQAEFSPKASRGRYVCAQLSTLNFGKAPFETPLAWFVILTDTRNHDGILD